MCDISRTFLTRFLANPKNFNRKLIIYHETWVDKFEPESDSNQTVETFWFSTLEEVQAGNVCLQSEHFLGGGYADRVIMIDNLKKGKNYHWIVLCIRINTTEGSNQIEMRREEEGRCAPSALSPFWKQWCGHIYGGEVFGRLGCHLLPW